MIQILKKNKKKTKNKSKLFVMILVEQLWE